MEIWVLIIALNSNAITTQEFSTRERCETALVEAKNVLWGVNAVCVQK